MNSTDSSSGNTNVIATDTSLRKQLRILHEMLAEEITDVVSGERSYAQQFFPHAETTLKQLSKLTAELSVLLLEARSSKKDLSPTEEKDYHMIQELTDLLGNLQYELSTFLKKLKSSHNSVNIITEENLRIMNTISNIQNHFRRVRMHINDYTNFSQNSVIADVLDGTDEV